MDSLFSEYKGPPPRPKREVVRQNNWHPMMTHFSMRLRCESCHTLEIYNNVEWREVLADVLVHINKACMFTLNTEPLVMHFDAPYVNTNGLDHLPSRCKGECQLD